LSVTATATATTLSRHKPRQLATTQPVSVIMDGAKNPH
jgi:hypothetical protein